MKLFLLLIIFLIFCACDIAQTRKQVYYTIEIRESGMLFDDFFTIKNDSIIIIKMNIRAHKSVDTYSKALADI